MCGIAGYLGFDGQPASTRIVKAMTDAIAHRGPDDEGQYVDGPFGLGHRRLSIIDLSPAGHQPMQSPDGRYVLSYNGEIYNYQELRALLEAQADYRFRSRSDTEVLLAALTTWGMDALSRLNGMFAFALWDRTERSLTLARDRFGIKPLYWMKQDRQVTFGSEVKAILAHPDSRPQLDLEGLFEYMTFQNLLTDRTLFSGIHIVPPATILRIDSAGVVESRPYWDYDFREGGEQRSEAESDEELNFLFQQAVSRQMVSDVPVGSYLSGGMDSGSITAIAARQVPDLRTFTVGFDHHSVSGLEVSTDEREPAELMSYRFKTEHYEMVLKAGDMERCMQRLVWHLEEPRVGQSYPNFYAAQLASKFGKVVLAGTGGDEMFGGYPWRYYRAVVNSNFEDYVDKYYVFWQRLVSNSDLRKVFAPVWPSVEHIWTRDIFRDVFGQHPRAPSTPEDYINHSLYFEAKTFLHSLLVVEDKLSMAHGLENRVPFLDNELVDFAMRLPVAAKLGNLGEIVRLNENQPGRKTRRYFNKTRDGKLILRRVMSRHIPEEITSGIKQGFSAPDASWFRGESIDYVRDILYAPRARIFDILDRTSTLALIDEHLAGKRNRRLLIWSLLNLEQWLATFVGAASAPNARAVA